MRAGHVPEFAVSHHVVMLHLAEALYLYGELNVLLEQQLSFYFCFYFFFVQEFDDFTSLHVSPVTDVLMLSLIMLVIIDMDAS